MPWLAVAAIDATEKVKDLGAYAGFASVLGLAVLAVLYFGQARELKRLREWAGRAPERAAEMQARAAAAGAAAPATPAPAARPRATPPAAPPVPANGAAPRPVTAAAATAAGAASTPVPAPEAAVAPVASPSGTDPEGASAPAVPGAPAPATPAGSAAPVATPDTDPGDAPATEPPSDATQAIPVVEPGLPPIPPVRAVGGPGAALPPRTPAGADPLRSAAAEPDHAGRAKAVAAIVAGVVVLGVGGAFAAGAFSGGDDAATPKRTGTAVGASDATASTPTTTRATTPPIRRGDFKVAVQNGTAVNNAARAAADRLSDRGYVNSGVGTLAGGDVQVTRVYFQPGRKRQALDVARLLTVPSANVTPADAAATAFGQDADVVVTLGADKAQ